MYNGKYTRENPGKRAGKYRRSRGRSTALVLALIVLLGLTIGGTIAYLVSHSDPVKNEFVPANVKISIDEEVDKNVKTQIEIKNESNIPVYIRVALVANWADAEGKICINHYNSQPSFTLGTDWTRGSDGFYYYTKSVAVGRETTDLLDSDIELKEDDGCSLQVEVIASAIQADGMGTDEQGNPVHPVELAWGSTNGGSVTGVTDGNLSIQTAD